MDYFNSLTQTQQILAIIVAALVIFILGTFIYRYFNSSSSGVHPHPSGFVRDASGVMRPVGPGGSPDERVVFDPNPGNPNHITPLSEESVNLVPPVYAMFYTDWCGYCKQTHPAWEQVMRTMNGYKGVQILKVNCEENPDLANLHGVKSYPTIKLMLGGLEDPTNCIVYQGDRSAQDMTEFLQSNL